EADAMEASLPEPKTAVEHLILAMRESSRAETGNAGSFSRALEHTTQAIVMAPGWRLFVYALRANIAGQARNRNAAIGTATALKAHWPDSYVAFECSGFALLECGDPALLENAIEDLRKAIRIRPDRAAPLNNLSNALLLKGHID